MHVAGLSQIGSSVRPLEPLVYTCGQDLACFMACTAVAASGISAYTCLVTSTTK